MAKTDQNPKIKYTNKSYKNQKLIKCSVNKFTNKT